MAWAMDLDLSEDAFEVRDPWRLRLVSIDENAKDSADSFSCQFIFSKSIQSEHICTDAFTVDTTDSNNPFVSQEIAPEELKLPELGHFDYGALTDLPSLEQSEVTDEDWKAEAHPGPVETSKDHFDDLWEDIVASHAYEDQHLSWEAFQEQGPTEASSAYLSEAGKEAFDVALHLRRSHSKLPEEISVIRNDIFLRSLFDLGLGRSSALFSYDRKRKTFTPTQSGHSIAGLSFQSANSVIERLTLCGRLTRHLRDFVDRTYASGKAYPAKVALANAVATVVDALEERLTTSSRSIVSVLQLQEVFERPQRMLSEVYDLARAVRNARTNEELATLVYRRCQNCDQEPEWLRSLMLQILARVSQPWLELAEQWIGFKDDIGMRLEEEDTNFVDCEKLQDRVQSEEDHEQRELLYTYRPDKLPLFMTTEDGEMLFNLGRDLRILRTHHSDHPLAQTAVARERAMSLAWQHSWADVDRVAAKAKELELALKEAIKSHRDTPTHDFTTAVPGSADVSDKNDHTYDPFALPSFECDATANTVNDELFDLVAKTVINDITIMEDEIMDFSPPAAILPVLSFNPLLLAQQKILNAVMMRLFFRSHDLRLHLNLQRSFHLFGDGVFVSRLTAALFDPEQASTERQRGVMRSGTGMGLRLGSRGAWPPASSELRLALMGILSDSYESSFPQHSKRQTSSTRNKDLPGSLSFAIRQLSEEEAEKILDADSLHALDFLRLQYTPPSPLGAIITPASLDRYDTIFKFMLRLTRLLFVVAHLPRSSRSTQATLFRWQADAFVTTCSRYFFGCGIKETWSAFAAYLDSIECRLQEEDDNADLATRVQEGIEDIRRQHDACLDRISFALLLRTRQQKVMKVLEEILNTILEFSKLCHTDTEQMDAKRIAELHKSFNENVKLFLEVCRGLAGKKGYGKSSAGMKIGGGGSQAVFGDENTIERLVTALDFNGFYERRS